MTHSGKTLGQRGEDYVARQLQRAGYTILARNWRHQLGELDIIAQSPGEQHEIVFVEVRTRQGSLEQAVEAALESVNGPKQARLAALVDAYMDSAGLAGRPFRIDVAAVGWQGNTRKLEVITNAIDW